MYKERFFSEQIKENIKRRKSGQELLESTEQNQLTIDILSEGRSNYIFQDCKKSKKYLNFSEKIKNKNTNKKIHITNQNKKDKSFSKKNRINFTFAIYLIKYIIINYLVINALAFNNYHFFKLNFQKIKLRIKKSGKHMKIYHEYSGLPQPQYVYINGRRYTPSNYMDLTASDNFIEIIWPDNFNLLTRLFCNSEMDEIDLSDFDTSQVVIMQEMLSDCQSLTSFVMSKYGTKNLKYLTWLFQGCLSLTSLDLTDFDMSNVEQMGRMFYECTKLQTINLNNFNGNKLTDYNDIFYKVPDNVIVCIQDIPNNRKLLDLLQNKPGFIKGSVYNYVCINYIDEDIENTYNGSYFENCINGYLGSNYSDDKYKCEIIKSACQGRISCSVCNNNYNYYQKEDDYSNNNDYINCYKYIKGYYLDKEDFLFKKCYFTCEDCETNGNHTNHNCLKCNSNYSFALNLTKNGYTNCYQNCSYYYYFDDNNNFYCTNDFSCPNGFNKLIPDKGKCVDKCYNDNIFNNIYQYEFRNTCYKECPDKYSKIMYDNHCSCNEDKIFKIIKQQCTNGCKLHEIVKNLCIFENLNLTNNEYLDIILKYIEKGLLHSEYNITNLDNGEYDIMKLENIIIELTTLENQKKKY